MIKAYTSQRMTGHHCDEMLVEAQMLVRVLGNYGITALNPVLEENIPKEHILLPNVAPETLEKFWHRDKQMIRESDILIDYLTQNMSDGSNNEVGYNRWCLWKPTIRVWNGKGALISRMEDDIVVPTLLDAITLINEKFGTYEQLGQWRTEMLERSFPKWLAYQQNLIDRYSMNRNLINYLMDKAINCGG
jgi:hypothetical protein